MKFKKKILILILLIFILIFSIYLIKIKTKPKLEIKLISPVNEVFSSKKINLKFILNTNNNMVRNCNIHIGTMFRKSHIAVENKWELFNSENRGTAENSAIFEDNNKIYQVGFGGADEHKEMVIYDIETDSWTTLAPYPFGLEGASFTNYKNNFYVFGGSNTTSIHNLAYKYDIKENKWIKIRDLPYPLRGSTSALINNKLHMIGGETGTFGNLEITNKHLVYDFEKSDYYYEKKFPNPIKFSSYGVIDDKIYVFGGNSVSNLSNIYQEPRDEIYSYDTKTKKWKFETKLPQRITALNRNSIIYNDKISLLGGHNGFRRLDTIYTYDPSNNNVEEIYPQLPMSMENINTILINDKIYLLGGFCFYEPCFEDKYYFDISKIKQMEKIFWYSPSIQRQIEPNKLKEETINMRISGTLPISEAIYLWYVSCEDNDKIYNSTIASFEII